MKTIALKMLHTPEVLVQIGKGVVRRTMTGPLYYHFGNGYSGSFGTVHIKIVNACNLRCKMCGQWGEEGWHFDKGTAFIRQLLPLSTYKKLVDDVAPLKPWISFTGGEPFLYPDLVPLLAYTKYRGLSAVVSTNGLTLAKHGEELADIGLDFLYVSIDGTRAVHDRIRGMEGAFDKTLAGIKTLQQHKRRLKRVKPYLVIAAAISTDNSGILDQIFEVAEEVEADWVVTSYGWFQTEESCREHEKVMQEKLEVMPFSQRGFLGNYDHIDVDAVIGSIRRVRARSWSFSYSFIPELAEEDIPRYYREHSNTFGHDVCLFPWSFVQILPNGDVTTCAPHPDYIVGNIKDSGILDIWNNDRYRKFRNVLKEGLLPVCSRCCGLMAGGRAG